MTAIELEYLDAPLALAAGDLLVEATRIPHSGWPDTRLDVQNISLQGAVQAGAAENDTADSAVGSEAEPVQSPASPSVQPESAGNQ